MSIAPAFQRELDRLARVEARNRRERIAAVLFQGLLANPSANGSFSMLALQSVTAADALIEELDKEDGR